MFYDVIRVYSVRSIVLRVRNKGDDDDGKQELYCIIINIFFVESH